MSIKQAIYSWIFQSQIEESEKTVAFYRKENNELRDEIERLKAVELKAKIMELYIDDDAAILELLECKKEKSKGDYAGVEQIYRRNMALYGVRAINGNQANLLTGLQRGLMGI